jgi:hypothetical protein
MAFRKLVERDGSGTVTPNKDDLRLDGLVDQDGRVRPDREMHVQRLGRGAYLVRAVEDGTVPEINGILRVR